MLVGDILSNTYEGTKVDLYDARNNEWLASYDGRNSIPSFFNQFKAVLVYVDPDGILCIDISAS